VKTLIWTDSHICRENIDELQDVFPEIMSYKADRCICLGDYYDKKLLHHTELWFGTSIIKKFADTYPEFIMLEGNHDKDTIKYIEYIGGATVVPQCISNNDYFGHFFVNESLKSFNSAKVSLNELDKYRYVFLGHQHSFQVLGNKRYHPGSIIWVDFGEVDDIQKCIFMLEDDKLEIIELKTPIPMRDVFSLNELDTIPKRTKVRYVIKNFSQLKKHANELDKYKNKFYSFKIKLDFDNSPKELEMSPKKSINEIIDDWLKQIIDNEVKTELELSFREEH
jgi:predicted phosphodiesterase